MREKNVKLYFVLSRLAVSDFWLFNVLFWSLVKKFKVLGSHILESWVLGPEPFVLGPTSHVSWPRSWVLDPDSRVFRPSSQVLGPGSWSWLLRFGSWVLILDYVAQNKSFFCHDFIILLFLYINWGLHDCNKRWYLSKLFSREKTIRLTLALGYQFRVPS